MVAPDLLRGRDAGREGEVLFERSAPAIWREPAVATVTSKPPRFSAAMTRGSSKNGAFSDPMSAVERDRARAERVAGRADDPVPDADDQEDREPDRGEAPRALVRHASPVAGLIPGDRQAAASVEQARPAGPCATGLRPLTPQSDHDWPRSTSDHRSREAGPRTRSTSSG